MFHFDFSIDLFYLENEGVIFSLNVDCFVFCKVELFISIPARTTNLINIESLILRDVFPEFNLCGKLLGNTLNRKANSSRGRCSSDLQRNLIKLVLTI
jgi:hypothetical protein